MSCLTTSINQHLQSSTFFLSDQPIWQQNSSPNPSNSHQSTNSNLNSSVFFFHTLITLHISGITLTWHYSIMALIFKKKPHFSLMHCPQSVYAHHLNSSPRSLSPYLSLSLNSRLKSLASWHYDYNNFECNGFDICTQNTHTVKKQRTCIPCYYCISHSIPPSPQQQSTFWIIIRNYVLQQRTILYLYLKQCITMCIYLLDIYYPKIHLSYILLFIQNKTLV